MKILRVFLLDLLAFAICTPMLYRELRYEATFDAASTKSVYPVVGASLRLGEPSGAERFVPLVEQYLADHRTLFFYANGRKKLINCLAVFVNVAWSETMRLFQKLPEILE